MLVLPMYYRAWNSYSTGREGYKSCNSECTSWGLPTLGSYNFQTPWVISTSNTSFERSNQSMTYLALPQIAKHKIKGYNFEIYCTQLGFALLHPTINLVDYVFWWATNRICILLLIICKCFLVGLFS